MRIAGYLSLDFATMRFQSLIIIMFNLILLGAGPQAAGAACQLIKAADVPVHGSPGAWRVDSEINGKPAQLLFDTGAFSSIIRADSAHRLNMLIESAMVDEASGIGGSRTLSIVAAKSFRLGALRAENFLFYITKLNLGAGPNAPDGLVSSSLLSRYDIDLDVIENRIGLYYHKGDCSDPHTTLTGGIYAIPLLSFADIKTPRVEVSINGQSLVAIIDSGAPTTTIFRSAAHRLGLDMDRMTTDPKFKVSGIGSKKIDAISHAITPISIGPLTLSHMAVDIVDQREDFDGDMLLGADFQQRIHVWISYSSKSLIMQYPPAPSPPVAP